MKEMEYRGEFIITLLHLIIFTSFQVFFYRLIFSNASSIGEWSYWEMIGLVGTFIIIDSLFFTFFLANMANFDNLIRRAELDSILVKPVNHQFYASFRKIMPKEITSLVFGFLMLVVAVFKAGNFDLWQIFLYLLFFITSLLIVYASGFIFACIFFFIAKSEGLYEVFISLWQFAKLPDVYKGYTRIFFMLFLPIAFASYVPSGALFGKVPLYFLIYYLFFSFFLLYLSTKTWKLGLKYYKSTGG